MSRFQKLTLTTAVVTYLLVVMGAITRGTGSGMGCGYDWPLCHGVLPPLSDTAAWIEWWHRALALTIGILVTLVAVVAVLRYRDRPSVVLPAIGAFGLTLFQAWLGQVTVETGNAGEWVTAHLATAMLVLAVLTYIAVRMQYPGRFGPSDRSQRFTLLAAFAAASVYALLLFGSHVTASGATFAFPDWPLFGGQLLPSFAADPTVAAGQEAQFLHRIVAVLVGLIVLATAWVAWRRYAPGRWGAPEAQTRLLAMSGTAAALYLIQVVVGALQISTRLASWAVALHVALGAAIWALLVAAAVTAYCAARFQPGTIPELSGPGGPGSGSRRREHGAEGTPAGGPGPAPADAPPLSAAERLQAYIALTKPRIVELLLVTTVPAMVLAARGVPRLDLMLWTLLGGALAAGSANAINQVVDRDIDALMTRTRRRPVPGHRIATEDALVFGLALGVVAFAELAILVNLVAAYLALLAIGIYVVVYTLLLKRSTPQNIVIGGAAGALPPVIGWAAVTGDVTLPAIVLFLIVFYWTPPHFWALSLRLRNDYAAASVPMLPVVHGVPETARQILLYTLVMVALSLALFSISHLGLIYLGGAVLLGGLFVRQAVLMWRDGTDRRAMAVYRYSISYLGLLFALVAVDVLVPLAL
jgi:protoheme IX farnesyltransferase